MNTSLREAVREHIVRTFDATSDHPWARWPSYEVFRHAGSGKWFALVMDVPRRKLGLPGEGNLDILNVKCDPLVLGSLLHEDGFLPAYHMSKTSWVSIALDGTVEMARIEVLLDMSYELTAPRAPKGKA